MFPGVSAPPMNGSTPLPVPGQWPTGGIVYPESALTITPQIPRVLSQCYHNALRWIRAYAVNPATPSASSPAAGLRRIIYADSIQLVGRTPSGARPHWALGSPVQRRVGRSSLPATSPLDEWPLFATANTELGLQATLLLTARSAGVAIRESRCLNWMMRSTAQRSAEHAVLRDCRRSSRSQP